MAETMKTFVMQSVGNVGFTEKPVPDPGPNDAVVKTTRDRVDEAFRLMESKEDGIIKPLIAFDSTEPFCRRGASEA
jgi:hypothetical protein